jgi:hypothetical protein
MFEWFNEIIHELKVRIIDTTARLFKSFVGLIGLGAMILAFFYIWGFGSELIAHEYKVVGLGFHWLVIVVGAVFFVELVIDLFKKEDPVTNIEKMFRKSPTNAFIVFDIAAVGIVVLLMQRDSHYRFESSVLNATQKAIEYASNINPVDKSLFAVVGSERHEVDLQKTKPVPPPKEKPEKKEEKKIRAGKTGRVLQGKELKNPYAYQVRANYGPFANPNGVAFFSVGEDFELPAFGTGGCSILIPLRGTFAIYYPDGALSLNRQRPGIGLVSNCNNESMRGKALTDLMVFGGGCPRPPGQPDNYGCLVFD